MRIFSVLLILCFSAAASIAQTQFGSAEEMLQYADEKSTTARIAKLSPQIAREKQQMQASLFYPRINAFAHGDYYPILATQLIPAEVLGGKEGTFLKAQFGMPYTLSTGAELSLPLLNLENWSKFALTKTEYRQSLWNSAALLENFHLLLLQNYYQLLAHQAVHTLNAENLAMADTLLDIYRKRFEEDIVDPADLNRTKNLYLSAQNNSYVSGRNVKLATTALEELLDVDSVYLSEELSGFAWPPLPHQTDITERPAFREAEFMVRTAELSLQQSKNSIIPRLDMVARYSYNLQTDPASDYGAVDFNMANIGLRLNMPLFNGFYHHAGRQAGELQLENARLKQEQIQNELTRQMEEWEIKYLSALSKNAVLESKVANSRETLRIARLSMQQELMEFDQYNNILNEYNLARMEYLQNLADGIFYYHLCSRKF